MIEPQQYSMEITPIPEEEPEIEDMSTPPVETPVVEAVQEPPSDQSSMVSEQQLTEPEIPVSGDTYTPEDWFQTALKEQDPVKREYYLKRCIKMKPAHVPALLELGNLYLARAQEEEKYGNREKAKDMAEKAVDQYEKIIKLNPDLPNVYLNLGVIFRYYLDNPRKVIQYWEKYLTLVPASDRHAQIKEELDHLRRRIE